ncbi:MAG TPA: cytochrome c biogenesis protein CcsA [Planctomycetota bacterium]|nr:cytochrome c biogenesis protein CcsA [Planctomycetota bacterium]
MTLEALGGPNALVTILAGGYGVTLFAGVPTLWKRNRVLIGLSIALMTAAFLLNTWIIFDRWQDSGRPPFKTLFETLLFYPWCVGFLTFVLLYLHRLYLLIPFSAAISLSGLIYALARPDVEIVNLPPALQSVWFVPHVVTYFVAYAALFISFALALLALFLQKTPSDPHGAPRLDASSQPPAAPQQISTDLEAVHSAGRFDALRATAFDRHAHHAAIFGFCALTLGLVMGATWGKFAWGDYWSWDTKENWALVTWLAYAIYVHIRLLPHWNGRRAMTILVVAFAAVVFTYLGMSLLPTAQASLHVYQ